MPLLLGPNIEKSVKDLQRCTVSLTRYRVMIKEEVDSSVKKIKAAFAELHNWWVIRPRNYKLTALELFLQVKASDGKCCLFNT